MTHAIQSTMYKECQQSVGLMAEKDLHCKAKKGVKARLSPEVAPIRSCLLQLPNMSIVYIFGHTETRPTLSLLALEALARR